MAKKVTLPNRYDKEQTASLHLKKSRLITDAENRLGLDAIGKYRGGYFGRRALERLLGKINDMFWVDDYIEGLGEYEAYLSWFRVTKEKDGDPKLVVKVNVVRITYDKDGRETYNNTYPFSYDVLWADNVIDAIDMIIDKLYECIHDAQVNDYHNLPEELKG